MGKTKTTKNPTNKKNRQLRQANGRQKYYKRSFYMSAPYPVSEASGAFTSWPSTDWRRVTSSLQPLIVEVWRCPKLCRIPCSNASNIKGAQWLGVHGGPFKNHCPTVTQKEDFFHSLSPDRASSPGVFQSVLALTLGWAKAWPSQQDKASGWPQTTVPAEPSDPSFEGPSLFCAEGHRAKNVQHINSFLSQRHWCWD